MAETKPQVANDPNYSVVGTWKPKGVCHVLSALGIYHVVEDNGVMIHAKCELEKLIAITHAIETLPQDDPSTGD